MAERSQTTRVYDSSGQIDSTGSSNAYVIRVAEQISAYHRGMAPIRFKANFGNTGSATANIATELSPSGLGAVTMKKGGGASDLASGDIVSGGVYTLIYDGTNFQVLEMNGGGSGSSIDAEDVNFAPAGDIAATDVQAAIEELDAEKQPLDADLTAIAALTGTDTIYYRSAADTWSPVVIDSSLTFAGGTLAINPSGGSPIASVVVQAFTASGTYTPTSGMKYAIIEVQAPGGGGGGADSNGTRTQAGGGGGGEYARGVFSAATVGVSQTVTIGAVGAAGTTAGGNGGTGGTTSVGALITAIGGSGGTGTGSNSGSTALRAGGAGGTGGTGGTVRIPGGAGGSGFQITADVGGITTFLLIQSGAGGQSHMGNGGAALNTVDAAGNAGGSYGGGGGGATEDDGTGQLGGAGGAAIVVITEFI